jgi:glutamate synthase domain-containing protein 1/glutamate synthase domain-containing protein 3
VNNELIQRLLDSKKKLIDQFGLPASVRKGEEEGGCGVVGFCCTEPVPGKHIYEPSKQMHNRGNGKGGGIAAVGLVPEQLGVSREILEDHYMLHIAFLEPGVKDDVEGLFITPHFDIAASRMLDTVADWKTIPGLEVKPPDVCRYFVRVKADVLDRFIAEHKLQGLDRREAEDEYVNQNSFKLNEMFYSAVGDKRAFVLSHGRNIMILKVVGFAEAIVDYYKIRDLCAHVWIAHQRFPTKGRVWHPAGAHPFTGINIALVHNGDFANYHSVCEHLMQRHIRPQFLTDTEVSVLLFDLLSRTYHYSLEHIIEALAPTSELDFDRLPEAKKKLYRAIQATHIHGSPDGPWFFIIARNNVAEKQFQLLGITDTAMLRPQVFAFCDGDVQVGLIASEKQAIDATLLSLSKDDIRICPVADRYWNARGGSHTDGGAFIFNLTPDESGRLRMTCTDKFGNPVSLPNGSLYDFASETFLKQEIGHDTEKTIKQLAESDATGLYRYLRDRSAAWDYDDLRAACRLIADNAKNTNTIGIAIKALTMLNDLRYGTGTKKRSHLLHILRGELARFLKGLPRLNAGPDAPGIEYRLIDFATRGALRAPLPNETTLVIDAFGFPPEGEMSDASLLMDAYMKGWRRFISFGCIGQRYIGNGLGPESDDVSIDVYGSSGDYLASGIDGMTIAVHGNAQDQLGQIIKRGKLVIYGDVGQTFLYGAKGGEIYVMGNAAGRPLINSVGKPRVVINGTCLDFLGESFMAGDPHNGGGFVVLNGVRFDDNGALILMDDPYPGSNIFSLASGGAIYVRDPGKTLVEQQLNGGMIAPLTKKDWELILPYLEENERLFQVVIDDLLTVDGKRQRPQDVYRKVVPFVAGKVAEELEDDLLDEEFLEEEPLMEAGVTGQIDTGFRRPEHPDIPDIPEA